MAAILKIKKITLCNGLSDHRKILFLKSNMREGHHNENKKLQYLGNAMTNRHKIRKGDDAQALNRPCAAMIRPFVKLL